MSSHGNHHQTCMLPTVERSLVMWNSCGLNSSLAALHLSLSDIERCPSPSVPSVFAFCEAHTHPLYPRSTQPMPNYTWHTQPHTSNSGGLAMLIHNSVAAAPVEIRGTDAIRTIPGARSTQLMWMRIALPQSPSFLLGLIYIWPGAPPAVTAAITNVIRTAEMAGHGPVLLVGDFNLRHPDWDNQLPAHYPDNSESAAQKLCDLVRGDRSDMHLLNNELMPGVVTHPRNGTHRSDNIGTVIDLAMCTHPELCQSMNIAEEWEGVLHSDHRPILLQFAHNNREAPLPVTQIAERIAYRLNSVDKQWRERYPTRLAELLTGYAEQLHQDSQTTQLTPQAYIDSATKELEQIIHSAATDSIGIKRPRSRANPWFGRPGVAEAYDNMIHTERSYRHKRATRQQLQEARKQFRTKAKLAKELCWLEFVAQVQADVDSPLNWSVFKRSRGESTRRPLNALLGNNDTLPSNLIQSLNNATSELVRSAIPPALDPLEQITTTNMARLQVTSAAYDNHPSNNWIFTPDEIQQQCKEQHNTAPGPDSIPPALLRYGGNALYEALAALFNYSWHHSVIPKTWTSANVVLLSKDSSSKAPNRASSYRPVSLTSAIMRTFEHLLHTHLTAQLNSQNYFSSTHSLQFGFRGQHSTSDAIGILLRDINLQQQQQRCLPVAFLDLRKAFDRVDHSRLILSLTEAGIGGRALIWLAAFVRNRTIRVIDRGYAADWHKIDYGVPQGSVLAPLLFLLFIQGAAKAVDEACHGTARLTLYADDVAAHPVATHLLHSPISMHHSLQTALTALARWARSVRMEFNPSKSKVVVFGSPTTRHIRDMNKLIQRIPLRIGFTLEVVPRYEYLGLWLSSNLSWVYHANEQLKRARHDAFLITRLLRPPAAPHLDAVKQLIQGFLIPRFNYAMEHWIPPPKVARQLQEQIARPIRRVLGLPPTTHTLGVFVEAGIPSINTLCELAVLRCLQRLTHKLRTNHPAKGIIRFSTRWAMNATALFTKWFGNRPRNSPISKKELYEAALKRTHLEWRNDPNHPSEAPLLEVIEPVENGNLDTTHLHAEHGRLAMLRARMRARRALTLHTRARFNIGGAGNSPVCTHTQCQQNNVHDTIQHILMECPRHSITREEHSLRASALLGAGGGMTLAIILGSHIHNGQRLPPNLHRTTLALTGGYIRTMCAERLSDGLPEL